MSSEITHQESSWTTWFNPLSYFGSASDKSALGRNAPSKNFTKFLLSQEGKQFVATTPKELNSTITSLRKVLGEEKEDFGKLIREGKDIPRKMDFADMSEQSEVLAELKKTVPPRDEDKDPNEGKEEVPLAPPAPSVESTVNTQQGNFLDELKNKTKPVPAHSENKTSGYYIWNGVF